MSTREKYTGKLKLKYTDADDLEIVHSIRMSEGYSLTVAGNCGNGSYEWVCEIGGKISHSDCGYGDSDIALRDGLLVMHPMRNEKYINEGKSDHELLLSAICAGKARWQLFASDFKTGDIIIGQLAFNTQLDADGLPHVSDACCYALRRVMNPNSEVKQVSPKGRWTQT